MHPPASDIDPRSRARAFPDRSAYLHRRRAHRIFLVVVALLLVLPWFGYRHVRAWLGQLRPAAVVAQPAGPAASRPAAPPAGTVPADELDRARTAAQPVRIREPGGTGDEVQGVRPGPPSPPRADDAASPLPVDLEAHRKRNAESMRILEETTPEM